MDAHNFFFLIDRISFDKEIIGCMSVSICLQNILCNIRIYGLEQ